MKFHHIGIATSNIDELINKISKFMSITEKSEIIYDELQDANLCMLTLSDGVKLELIQGKVVENIVKKHQYLYHTCYSVKDIVSAKEELIKDGAFLVREELPAILFNNRRVAFLMWDLGLIELVEDENDGVN